MERQGEGGPDNHQDDPLRTPEVVWPQVSEMFGEAKRFVGAQFVYVIGEADDGPLKIGKANDPIARLRGMQTGNPRRLRVEYVLLGDLRVEKLLHELWEPFAIKSAAKRGKVDAAPGTEWFRAEIRAELFPIIETAVEKQLDYLADCLGDVTVDEMERLVREAHIEHDFVAKGRDQVLLLAAGAGYVSPTRPSRI